MNVSPQISEYLKACQTSLLAERAMELTLRRAFPLEGPVHWIHGTCMQHGWVKMHGSGDRLKAHNTRTDRDVWIHGWQIREALDKVNVDEPA